jgi:hypothetical protein
MILTGMGPVDPMKDNAAKLFASAYALFSGVVFLSGGRSCSYRRSSTAYSTPSTSTTIGLYPHEEDQHRDVVPEVYVDVAEGEVSARSTRTSPIALGRDPASTDLMKRHPV